MAFLLLLSYQNKLEIQPGLIFVFKPASVRLLFIFLGKLTKRMKLEVCKFFNSTQNNNN